MTKAIKATASTVTAIQKAAKLRTDVSGGAKERRNTVKASNGSSTNIGGDISSGYPCKITGAMTGGAWPVAVYKEGKSNPSTGTGKLQVLQLHISSDIPVGTWLMGFDTTLVNYNSEA
jgi:hypothetical protein